MTWVFLEEVTIYRYIDYIYIARTVISIIIALAFMYWIKDRQSLFIAGVSFLIGIAFEALAVNIGIRSFDPNDMYHFYLIIFLGGLEIAGATSIVWSVSSLLHNREENWKVKMLLWVGIIICITIIFPIIAGA